jgi:DNA invertase Pin-like site-specific DNA recombinase
MGQGIRHRGGNNRAVIYTRVAVSNGGEISLRARRLCESMGLRVVAIASETGSCGPGLDGAFDLARRKRAAIVVIDRLDRLGRSVGSVGRVLARARRSGLVVASTRDSGSSVFGATASHGTTHQSRRIASR